MKKISLLCLLFATSLLLKAQTTPEIKNIAFYLQDGVEILVFVVLNMSDKDRSFKTPHGGKLICSTRPSKDPVVDKTGSVRLRPFEAAIIECAKHPLKNTNT